MTTPPIIYFCHKSVIGVQVMNYLYVNYAFDEKGCLSKVGISNNPEKRIVEFNIGVRYRTSFKNSPVFKRFFTARIPERFALKKIEKEILSHFKPFLVPFYGREVFRIPPERFSLEINEFLGGICHVKN